MTSPMCCEADARATAERMLRAVDDYRVPAYNYRWAGRVSRLAAVLQGARVYSLRVYSRSGQCARLHGRPCFHYVGGTTFKYDLWAITCRYCAAKSRGTCAPHRKAIREARQQYLAQFTR